MHPLKILIADDDSLSRMILKMAVEQFGHECLVAEDGRQAWDIFQSAGVDVIIADRIMPRMDGMELCRKMREAANDDGYTYFIFLTALDEKEQLLAGIQAGADDYLSKPLHPEELKVRLIVASRITNLHKQLAKQKVQLKKLNQDLFEQGRIDALTQLGNRLRLMEDLVTLSARAGRSSRQYCALMCDVDFFKKYNDHYGHLAGDDVLRKVAATIRQTCRTGDTAYRFGGEEFFIILPDQSPRDAAIAAERLRGQVEALALPHAGKYSPGIVTISVGAAALTPDDSNNMDYWIAQVDEALYRAKAQGRNRVVVAGMEN